MHYKEIKLNDVWRICNKIRATTFRVNLNLWHHFLPYDPNRNYLISENQFITIFSTQLKDKIGLSEKEIIDLCDYFRIPDGRIFYKQLIDVVQENLPNFSDNKQLINGLEWDDPLDTNCLNLDEERRVNLLLTKIAISINRKEIILQPYFQDYEIITKNSGTITIPHFARLLHYLKITLSSDDFNLLVKKFIRNSYTINYVAFINVINEINQYFDNNGITDTSGDVFGGYTDLSKLPRAEIETISQKPQLKQTKNLDLIIALTKLQNFVYENRIRVEEFFKQFDHLKTGRITRSQFQRGLNLLSSNAKPHLYLSQPEIEIITNQYCNPSDPTLVCWQTFEDDIDKVFTVKGLEKTPDFKVGKFTKIDIKFNQADCEEICRKIKQYIKTRRIVLKPIFKDYDKNNTGYITISQMSRCLLTNNFPLSDTELHQLAQYFSNENGFNYNQFVTEINPDSGEDSCKDVCKNIEQGISEKRPANRSEFDIVQILAKIKRKVAKERINIFEFIKQYDQHNQQIISHENFIRSLSLYDFQLTKNEIDTIIKTFSSPLRCNFIDYKRFCSVIDEVFTQTDLERHPLIVPIQHLPVEDDDRNFLNFNERLILTNAMEKLSRKSELELNLIEIFHDFDKTNCGTISQSLFERALSTRQILNYLTRREFEIVCKCFSYERGMRDEVNYRDFINCLNLLNNTNKNKAC